MKKQQVKSKEVGGSSSHIIRADDDEASSFSSFVRPLLAPCMHAFTNSSQLLVVIIFLVCFIPQLAKMGELVPRAPPPPIWIGLCHVAATNDCGIFFLFDFLCCQSTEGMDGGGPVFALWLVHSHVRLDGHEE
eukprot:scaffold1112_cov92-Amphora_coffeaeformis.AAC.34